MCPSSARWRTAERAPRYWSIETISGLRRAVDADGDDGTPKVQAAHQFEHGHVVDDEDDRLDPLAEQALDDGADRPSRSSDGALTDCTL